MIDRVTTMDCVLCGACINACPVDAIHMERPYLDFLYPEIDTERCIYCNSCERACPALNKEKEPEKEAPIAFAAKSKDESVRMCSSSGGVFYELANQTLQEGGFICGAVFDAHFHVRHLVSDKPEDLQRMMGSKYAQSHMGQCYKEIREHLRAGKSVLFCGCPCQVAGLRTFLGKDEPNLLLVALICHGIPSDKMLQTYIGMQEKRNGAKLKNLEFRNKARGWHNSSVRMEFENHRVYAEPISVDAYMSGFLGSVFLKAACHQCRFLADGAGSDITIGDFWGAEAELAEQDDNRGLSAVLAHTQKGAAALERCALTRYPTKVETIVKYNRNLVEPTAPSPKREEFYAYAEERGYEAALEHFLGEPFQKKVKRRVRHMLRTMKHLLRGKGKPLY